MVPRHPSGTSNAKELGRVSAGKVAPKPRTKLLKEVLELQEVHNKDGTTRWTIKRLDDQFTFDKGFYVFVRALQLLKAHNDGVILVGLGGASGSGKTAFSEKIKAFMPGVVVISMDMYNDGTKVVHQNFDDPRLTDYDCLLANLADLKAGRATEVPIYDFKQSKRAGYTHVPPPEGRVVIIEGIYALNDKIRPMLDLRVSIAGGVHFDLLKRVMRDMQRAGQDAEAIIQQITETVYPMYKAFIEPDLQTAQLRITNHFNPFSGFLTPSYILKSQAVPDIGLIRQQLQSLGPLEEADDKDLADIYLLPPGEDPETCVTWLRMRNKDGRYTLMFEEWVTEEPFIISPRISFEVNVRILGGLMALGYEIGAILKRTSHIFKADDLTVKVDHVENLGLFIQILGKERDKVAHLGSALGLDGTYIAKSYIEQIQLSQLTSEFVSAAAEVRDKLNTTDNSNQVLSEILSASPATRIHRRFPRASASEPMAIHGLDSLSCSAPANAPTHMHMAQRSTATTGMSPSQLTASLHAHNAHDLSSTATSRPRGPDPLLPGPGASAGGSYTPGGGVGSSSSSPIVMAPLTQQSGFVLSPSAHVRPPGSGHSGSGRDLVSPNGAGLQQQQGLRPVGRPPSRVGSLGQMLGVSGSNGALTPMEQANHGSAAGVSRSVTAQLDKQLELIHHSVDQYSELKVQLDALVGQYQETHSALQQLSQANTQLASNMQALMTALAQAKQAAPAQATWPMAALGLATGLAVAGAVLLLAGRSRQA